ncbi:MAG TPA: DUF952 domain-containing protein [Candidatus Binatus sp.]|nr:DUF952 domain-containing protein [Candidatus Binatus sp.]
MIAHIVKRSEWDDAVARGAYAPESFRVEGFIHCSTIAQVIDTANRFYRGQKDLIVLFIEEERLKAEVKYEAPVAAHREVGLDNPTPNPFPNGKGNRKEKTTGESDVAELFPHLYGELNVDAVVRVVELPCEADGSFRRALQ